MKSRHLPRWRWSQRAALPVLAAAAMVLAACGGNTGSTTDSSGSGASAGSGVASQPSGSGSGSAQGSTSSGSDDKPLVYGVFATPLEEPWDGAVHQALQAAADAGEIVYKHTDSNDSDDKMTRTLTDLLTNQKPAIVVGDAFSSEDAVRAVAKDYPNVQFAFGSGNPPVDPNFSTFDNWLQDPAYLAGMLAGGVTKSGTIGVVAAMPIPEVNRIVNAFISGVAETNDKATVKVTFINSFFDPTTAKQAALAQVAQGADVLFAERDGVIEAAKEKNLPVIGMMVDQKDEAPKNVMTSLVWNMGPTIEEVIKEYKAGTLHSQDLGKYSFMRNGGSSLAPINTDVPGGIPQDLIDKVTAKQKQIMDGLFTTPIDEKAPAGSTTVGG
jgi:basic membrane lipoprotein Med (substrate-binding protein (PBP1-ABC) superfamily)